MRSVDTNVLLYSLNDSCDEFERARGVMEDLRGADDIVLCELVLVELYLLLRNPVVLGQPYSAADAASTCSALRRQPRWRIVDSADIMDSVWIDAARPRFPRRRIIDARLAYTLRYHGVDEWITRNAADFSDFGFERVWNPFD